MDAQPTNISTSDTDFGPLALLAGLTGSHSRQLELLKIITNPQHSNGAIEGDTHLEIADGYKDFGGYDGYDYNTELMTVADFLYAHYAGMEDVPGFGFGFDADSEGSIGSVMVTAQFGTDWDTSLRIGSWEDIKHSTTDRAATGLAAAVAMAEALDNVYGRLVVNGLRRGLGTLGPGVVAQAVEALAAYDSPRRDEPTVQALRDALAGILTAQGV